MENQLFLVDKIRLRSYMVNKSYGRLGLSSHHECKRDVAQLAKIVSAVVLILIFMHKYFLEMKIN